MNRRYRISPEGRPQEPTDAEIARYRDPKRLVYNYHRATRLFHRRPLYKDPKAFFALLLIVLLAWFISEVVDKEHQAKAPPATDQVTE
jgi:hypothetical protein